MCFTYGCSHDIQFNPLKSVVMYIDSRKLGATRPMMIGSDQLNLVSNYTYLGHFICDDLSDESDMKAKARQMYARSNMLRQRFHFCSSGVKNKPFTTFFLNNIYMCALWVKCTKATFHMFVVIIIIIIRQPLCPVVGRRPQHAVSKLPCLVLSSAISCRSSICPGRLSIAWLVSLVVFSCHMVSNW